MLSRPNNSKFLRLSLQYLRQCNKTASTVGNNNSTTTDKDIIQLRPQELVTLALEKVNLTKPQDWDKIKQFIINHELNKIRHVLFRPENTDGLMMTCFAQLNRLDLARSYLNYLESGGGSPNLATEGRYLKMLYDSYCMEKLPIDVEQEIVRKCDKIYKSNPILDARTLECMIMALSLTKEWKIGLDLCEEIKKTTTITSQVYSALIAAAFCNKQEHLAWDLLHQVVALERAVQNIAFLSYLKTIKIQNKREKIINNLEKLFDFYRVAEVHCTEPIVNNIINSFQLGCKATVQFSGRCENCGSQLHKLEITDTEFAELKHAVFNNVIVGKDVFRKTNPEEVRKFQHFVDHMKSYDVVLDGLNVGYSKGPTGGPQMFSKIVAKVINHFVQQNKSILMLGRFHMTKWPRKNWHYITDNSDIFLTQDLSQDDPYLLYCALHSGKNTIIVSKDLMRSHKFLLRDRKYKILFNRWLSERQYFLLNVNDRGRAFFRSPAQFSSVAQKDGNMWHVPYKPEADELVNEMYHKTWLCLDCS